MIIFDEKKAMQEYISDTSVSYRKLAKKYGVPVSRIVKLAKRDGWVEKRKQLFIKNDTDNDDNKKLSLLQKACEKSIEALYSKLDDELSINDIKNISVILKTLTGVQRDLNDLPTFKEKNSIRLSNERMQLVRAKIATGDEEENETGVVLIPFLDEEKEEEENVVFEGEENV